MAVSIEDILLARAQQEQGQGLTGMTNALGNVMPIAGALGGGIAGAAIGEVDLATTEVINRLKDSMAESQGLTRKGLPAMSRVKGAVTPGPRMAGGLVGAILGGALGTGAKQLMIQQSPAASLLAKLQLDGELSPQDQNALQNVLADTYSSIAR